MSISTVAIILMLMASTVVLATPAERLSEAREACRLGNYDDAIPLLSYLLYPNARLSSAADLVEAHVLLGVAYYETGDRINAEREFEEALFLDANLTLDALLFSRGAVEFFDESKRDFAERTRRDNEARELAAERDRLRQAIENMVVIEQKQYFINFVPFGAGQFQNGQDGKGVFFFVSQSILGGTSFGLWVWQVGKYGYNGSVPRDEVDTVFRLQQVQIVTGLACLGLMVGGIIDSLINYDAVTRRPADESLLPDDVKSLPPRQPSTSKRSKWRLVPAPVGTGAAISWEF